MALSSNQIDRLKAAADDPSDTGEVGPNADATEYYDVLGEEFIYGRMAGAVVANNRFDGILANNFITNKIVNDNGGSYTSTDETAVQQGLLAADYALRFDEAQPSGMWDELPGLAISDYHDATFTSLNYTTEAWTAYAIVRVIDSEVWRTESALVDCP